MEGGWIYVLMTSSDYQRFKVGLTINNPMLRVKQLRTGDPLIGLQVAYFIPYSLGKLSEIETYIHSRLDGRMNFHGGGLSEWFKGEPQDAWALIDSIFHDIDCIVTDHFQPSEAKVVRFWESDLISFYAPPPELIDGIPW